MFTIIVNVLTVNSFALSSKSSISLLTCSSGEELYTSFGHSALRVKDDSLGIDIVFNYGTFDFDTPFFIAKFVRGNLDYMLSTGYMRRFELSYKAENRQVVESKLLLNLEQRNALFALLVENARPQNRYYRYDFFYDNCATRIRDLVFKVANIDTKQYQESTNETFRNLLHICNSPSSWSAQGIDLILGAKTDANISLYDKAYLPMYVDSLFLQAGLIESSHTIIEKSDDINYAVNFIGSPLFVGLLILLFTIVFTILEFKKQFTCKKFDIILFSITFLLSILFWFLWLFTNHSVTDKNINVLWASLLYLPIVIILIRTQNVSRNKSLALLVGVNILFLIAFVMLTICGLQQPPTIALLVALSLAIRNISIYVRNR
ncbi:MAG: DUF4105 domain-containing protein [Marinilabiliaceae bacterium]|nr:DUF4105 domain-containing protein [Marinilabiliaceae bacterium]